LYAIHHEAGRLNQIGQSAATAAICDGNHAVAKAPN
jgi:hypothetical protein